MSKPILSVRINSSLYQRLKKEVKRDEVSKFLEEAIDEKLTKRELFEQELIAGYKRVAKNKKIQKELEVWDETISDMWKKDGKR
jgi:hypothetical protein